MVQQFPDPQGRVWSVALDSWLVPDGDYLRFEDVNGLRRLTAAEAERKRFETLMAKLRAAGINPDTL